MITDTGVIRKVAYNVRGFKEFDADTIFFSRAEQRLFRIPVLDVRDERFYKEEFREKKTVSAEIIKYGKYNKTTGEIEEVMTLGLPVISGATLLPEYGWYSREDKAARGAVYTEAHDALDEKEKQKADLRSEKREKKRQAKFARRKRRADRRAARKKKRAIRKGLYPSLPRRSRYTDSLPVTNLAQRTSFGSPDLGDDLDGKI